LKTIGHHTCKKEGSKEKVLKEAPYIAEYNYEKDKLQFLGTGYYFWDNNIKMAQFWGKNHYNNNYYILECDLNLEKPYFIDLVGNRGDILYFYKLINTFKKNDSYDKKWTIGHFIEFLKNKNNEIDGIFPFKAIRAIDFKPTKKKKFIFNFTRKRNNYTFLNPKIIICLIQKNNVILQSKRLIE